MLNPPLTTIFRARVRGLAIWLVHRRFMEPFLMLGHPPGTYLSRRMDTRLGHSPLDCGTEALRPVSFRSGSWKPFWMLTGGSLGSHSHASGPPSLPPRPRVLASFTVSMYGRVSGDGFDERTDVWRMAPRNAFQLGTDATSSSWHPFRKKIVGEARIN